MPKTIKELAEELGCSKTAVRKYMDADFRAAHTETNAANTIVIDDAGCKLLAETIKKPQETAGNQLPKTGENPGLQEEVAFLRAQLEAKDRQLDAKDRQIEAQQVQLSQLTTALEQTTKSLQAAQALHAGTMKQHLLPDAETESAASSEDEPEPSERKWWQFWKGAKK